MKCAHVFDSRHIFMSMVFVTKVHVLPSHTLVLKPRRLLRVALYVARLPTRRSHSPRLRSMTNDREPLLSASSRLRASSLASVNSLLPSARTPS